MKACCFNVNGGEFFISDFAALLIRTCIERRMNFEARFGRCGADKVYDDLIGFQWAASPVPGYMTEQSMFDFVPFARAGRKMAHFDFQACCVAESLQFDFPEAVSATIAATAVRRDQQAVRQDVTTTAKTFPPGSDRFDCELRRVAADANADPSFVVGQIVDSV